MTVVYKGAAKRLDDIDLPRIGAMIGVGEDELHAFMDVEAAGSGFDAQGRVKMLFEPHVFYRNLSGQARDRAVNAGLAYPKLKRNYPADSYPRFLAAAKIDETAACKASSWGLGQILGENFKAAGYDSPQAMISAFAADEEHHVAAIVKFLIAKRIAPHLKAHRWADVARAYNGAGYKANRYDERMAAAFAKWQKIRDTNWSPGDTKELAKDDAGDHEPAPAPKPSTGGGAAGGAVVAGGGAAAVAVSQGVPWPVIVVGVALIAAVAFFIWKRRTS